METACFGAWVDFLLFAKKARGAERVQRDGEVGSSDSDDDAVSDDACVGCRGFCTPGGRLACLQALPLGKVCVS